MFIYYMSKSKRLQWVVPKWPSRGRNKIAKGFVVSISSLEHAQILGLFTSVIKIYCFYSSRAFQDLVYSILNMLDQILKFVLTEISLRK